MVHPKTPVRPEHSKRCSGYEITQHPSNGTGNLSDEGFGRIGRDRVFPAHEIVCRRHLPIRSAHGDGPGGEVGRVNFEWTQCELDVPKNAGPFDLTGEKSVITLRPLRIVTTDVDDAATGYQVVLRRTWISWSKFN